MQAGARPERLKELAEGTAKRRFSLPGARVARVVATKPPWHVHRSCRYRVARLVKWTE